MLRESLGYTLRQLEETLDVIDALPPGEQRAAYTDSGVGRHLRHIFDHFLALRRGLERGTVDYDHRHRDNPVERDPGRARAQLAGILSWCAALEVTDQELTVVSEIDTRETRSIHFRSNLPRELLYLINHSIHHAAHIKLMLAGLGIALPGHIGLAPSTASHLRQQCEHQQHWDGGHKTGISTIACAP